MKKALLAFSFIIICLYSFSQDKGYYSEFKDPDGKTWRVGDVIETENGFLFSLRDQSSSTMESKVVKMSSEGVLLGEMSLSATDTTINLSSLFPSSNYDVDSVEGLAVCTTPEGNAMLLKLRIDGELNELGRSMFPLPSPDSVDYWLDDYRLLQTAGGYFALLSYRRRPTEKEIKLCKISNDGVITQVERMEDSLVSYVANLFHIHDDLAGFGIFLHKRQIPGTHINTCAMIYDGNLQLKRIYDIVNWYEDDGHGSIYIGDLSLLNSMMCPSSDGGYYISSRLNEFSVTGAITEHDQSAVLAKTDSAFQICPQYCIIGHLNDTVEAPSFYRSVDVNEEGMVYHCSMQNIIYDSWPYGNNGTHLLVTKTDTDLNVVWQKRFRVDGKIYSAFQTIATTDGGCMIIGNVYDHNSDWRLDIFVLKINADGTVGVDEMKEESLPFAYPNPVKVFFRIGGMEAKETYVYNSLGQCVMSFCGNEADVRNLAAGVYLLKIIDVNGKMQALRIVVTK